MGRGCWAQFLFFVFCRYSYSLETPFQFCVFDEIINTLYWQAFRLFFANFFYLNHAFLGVNNSARCLRLVQENISFLTSSLLKARQIFFFLGHFDHFSPGVTIHNSIVHLNNVSQPINTIPVRHCCPNHFEHIACSWPGHTDLFRQAQSRNTAFFSSNQVDSPKPLYQR